MPFVVYSYLSVEVVIICAYEARTSKSLTWPSRIIAYFITLLIVFDSIAGLLNISWTDSHLPPIGIDMRNSTAAGVTPPPTNNIAVFAIWNAGLKSLAGFVNACIVFSLVSVSNTSMYVASRTLYGMTNKIEAKKNIIAKVLRSFSIVVPKTGVPAAALIVSALTFIWMPFLQYQKDYETQSVGIGRTRATI